MKLTIASIALASGAAQSSTRDAQVAEQSCTNVSVVGDATYCVSGPICGGNGNACPKKGDLAIADCTSNIKSYFDSSHCYAPVDAECQKLPSGARGCVFPKSTPGKAAEVAEQSCTNVSVVGDATYCVQGSICGDSGDACPKKGDLAIADCTSNIKSYFDSSHCYAPQDAVCQKLPSGARGCVFGDAPPATTAAPATTAVPAITPAPSNNKQCSTNWSQCNGQNWPHGVCCQDPSFQCNYKNQYLSLCEPKNSGKDAEVAQVAVWQQCDGKDYKGDKTCTTGNKCVYVNDWYSQCRPDETASGLATWSQCGGKDYKGHTTCRAEDKCQKWNDWYSQCIPK